MLANFLYYDRKEDEDVTIVMIKDAIQRKVITVEILTKQFKKGLEQAFKDNFNNAV